MSAQEARRQEAAGQSEVERLKKELAALRQRLQDEVAYYQAETETTRQRVEAEQLRIHAQEVARRREVEDELARVKRQLQEIQEHSDRLQRRYDELNRQYLKQEESARLSAEEQVTQTREAARAAWQSAEEELAAMEAELNEARRQVAAEQERNRQLEETLGSLQGLEAASDEDREAALLEEVTALRKALNLSERGRGQANQRAVRLAEKLVGLQAEQERSTPADAVHVQETRSTPRGAGAGNPVQVDLTEANAVLRAAHGNEAGTSADDTAATSLGAELADEFQLIQADTSLDRNKLERLEQQVAKEDQRQAERDRQRAEAQQQRHAPLFGESPSGHRAAAAAEPAAVTTAQPQTPEPDTQPRRWPAAVALAVLLGVVGGAVTWFLGGFGY